MRKILLVCAPALFLSIQSSAQALLPFTTCPNVSVAIARSGNNADNTNPYHLYNVSTITGAVSQIAGGPFKEPQQPGRNLQLNAIGINRQDGFLYGLSTETTVTTARLLKLDKNYGVTNLGFLPSPTSPLGTIGLVNSAAGDVDNAGNYIYTAATINVLTGQATGFFLGKVANVQTLPAFNGGLPVSYHEVNISATCSSFITALSANLENTFKDISYNASSNSFFSYVTYRLPGAANYTGQLMEIKPIAGSTPLKYELVCTPTVNMHTAEVAGTLLDNAGNMLVLLTNGTMGKLNATGLFTYNGLYTPLNNNTGLPGTIRADMAGCGGPATSPLPVRLSHFTVSTTNCQHTFRWTAENEVDFSGYEVEQSTDNVTFRKAATVPARQSLAETSYQATVPATGQATYYRLKMMDKNGQLSYSRILSVNATCPGKVGFTVSPNPVLDQLNLSWQGNGKQVNADIQVRNASGAVVLRLTRTLPAGAYTVSINAGMLQKGAYWVNVIDNENNSSYQSRFIKQ